MGIVYYLGGYHVLQKWMFLILKFQVSVVYREWSNPRSSIKLYVQNAVTYALQKTAKSYVANKII